MILRGIKMLSLPTEIIYYIAEFLHPGDVYHSLRRVCSGLVIEERRRVERWEYVGYLLSIHKKPEKVHDFEIYTICEESKVMSGVLELIQKDKNNMHLAIYHNKLDVVKHLHNNGMKLSLHEMDDAISYGDMECIRYVYDNGGMFYTWTSAHAAEQGKLSSLIFAHENGAEMSDHVCQYAAFADSLVCLKYARENGAEWDKWTIINAKRRSPICLKYAIENGCPAV